MARLRRSATAAVTLASALAFTACRAGDHHEQRVTMTASSSAPPIDARPVEALGRGSAVIAGDGGVAGAPAVPVMVPRARGPITIDGEWNEPDWDKIAVRRVFTASGTEARPYSDIRFMRDRDQLIVGLYAADEDIRSGETFELTIGPLSFRVDATGRVSPTIPGVRAAIDRDGTLDRADDYDEEWVIELTIPLRALGIEAGRTPAPAHVRRCDTPKVGGIRCGSWDGALTMTND